MTVHYCLMRTVMLRPLMSFISLSLRHHGTEFLHILLLLDTLEVSSGSVSSGPVFIRTRDDIMITAISPHEDEYGNLHDRAVIYSNLGNGSWGIIGNPHGKFREHGKVEGIRRGGPMPYREVPSVKFYRFV